MDVIVGTAGHIDHGKTALVKALTGVDADRLPEEKQRGITIDIGFAELHEGDVGIGFVDVPGHERFVKNMLAGASGIDIVMLVIAADEGVMPQTREHFDICRLLKIKTGIVALTKADLVDAETLELARLDVSELVSNSFLENAPVFPVSSKTGAGVGELKQGLLAVANTVQREHDIYETRLPIDRSFSVKGFGAVVTGTLSSDKIGEGDELELFPSGARVRVRGVQAHGEPVKETHAGQRTAVNLAAVDHDDVSRGMVLAAPRSLSVTQSLDTEVEMLTDAPRGLRSRQRVRVHLGTAEVLARVSVLNDRQVIEPGSTGFAQLRLESLVASVHADRFILRSYSPQRTIGGGRVLDAVSTRHRKSDMARVSSTLTDLADKDRNIVETIVRMAGVRGIRIDELRSRTGLRAQLLESLIAVAVDNRSIVDANGALVSTADFEKMKSSLLSAIEVHHKTDKLSRGMPRELVRERLFKHSEPDLFTAVASELEREKKIVADKDVLKLASHELQLLPGEKEVLDTLRGIYREAKLEVPKLEEALNRASSDQRAARKIFQVLINNKEVVGVTPELFFFTDVVDGLASSLREVARTSGDTMIDVARFKEIAGVSRKYAIPLLEYFDRTRVTVRVGDKRQIL